MRAGQLRHRVTLERIRQTDVSDMGVPTEKWEAVGIYWAFVQPVSARQFVANDQLRGEVSHTVRMRYAPGVTDLFMRASAGDFDVVYSGELTICRRKQHG
jgi:head-tail adaptor